MTSINFGKLELARHMHPKRYTQAEVAQIMGVTQPTYSRWEQGLVKTISEEQVLKLIELFPELDPVPKARPGPDPAKPDRRDLVIADQAQQIYDLRRRLDAALARIRELQG